MDFRLTGTASVMRTIFAVSPRELYDIAGDWKYIIQKLNVNLCGFFLSQITNISNKARTQIIDFFLLCYVFYFDN